MLKAGKTLTRIETIKQWLPDVQPIILTHVGANQFPREIYVPHFYTHRMDVACSQTGKLKVGGAKVTYDIGGCLCFQVGEEMTRIWSFSNLGEKSVIPGGLLEKGH